MEFKVGDKVRPYPHDGCGWCDTIFTVVGFGPEGHVFYQQNVGSDQFYFTKKEKLAKYYPIDTILDEVIDAVYADNDTAREAIRGAMEKYAEVAK